MGIRPWGAKPAADSEGTYPCLMRRQFRRKFLWHFRNQRLRTLTRPCSANPVAGSWDTPLVLATLFGFTSACSAEPEKQVLQFRGRVAGFWDLHEFFSHV